MQTDSEITRILKALKSGHSVNVGYNLRGCGTVNGPAKRWIDVTVKRIDDVVYGSAYHAQFGWSEVSIRTKNGQNFIRINFGEWHVITSAESPFAK